MGICYYKKRSDTIHARRGTKDDGAFLDSAASCNPNERFPSTTRKHDDTRASTTSTTRLVNKVHHHASYRIPISKHFAQALLLIGANKGSRLEIDIQIRIYSIVSEVILLQHRKVQLNATLFNMLNDILKSVRSLSDIK